MRILKVDSVDIIRALKVNPYFEHLSEGDLQRVAACMSLREFERGETLFWEGDDCAGLHIVLTGSVKIYRNSPQGRQYIVRIAQEQDIFNEVSVFDGGVDPVNMAFYQVTHRLARLISTLPEEEQSGKGSHLTQEQLAARLGTVREVVARSLRELERSGAIQMENRRITVADSEALRQWAQGPWN